MNEKDPRFSTIERERVADRVAEELKRLIAGGTLAPGERLPGERQLADMMGVSRVSVRAALQQLKAHGLVTAVQGGGTRVIASAEALDSALTQLIQANTKNLRDLMELRAHLECWAAGRAASRAGEPERAAIKAALDLMSDPARPERLKAEDDYSFHMAVAKAAGSAVYMHLISVLGDVLEQMLSFHRFTLSATPADDARFLEHHRAIWQGIESGDPKAAEDAMADHLLTILALYSGEERDVPQATSRLAI